MSPIRSTFFTSTVRLHKVDKLIYRFHRTVNSFSQFILIILHQEETLQNIGVTPRIPVIDYLARLPVESHPPHLIIIHVRVQDTFLYGLTHLQGHDRIDFVKRLTEKIMYPRHQSPITTRTKVDYLFAEVRKRTFTALTGQMCG